MPVIGQQAPNFSANSLNGKGSFNLADFDGQLMVLLFAGITWCESSRRAAAQIPKMMDRFGNRGCQFVVVSVGPDGAGGETPDALAAMLAELDLDLPVVAASPALLTNYQVSSLPHTVLMTRDLRLFAVHTGTAREAELQSDLTEALSHPYLPPADRTQFTLGILDFLKGIANSRPAPRGHVRHYDDFTPLKGRSD